jgi:hypothetical protein
MSVQPDPEGNARMTTVSLRLVVHLSRSVDSPRLRYAGRPSLRQAAKRVKKSWAKKIAMGFKPIAIFEKNIINAYFKPLTNLVSFDLLFEALFL